MTDKNNRVHIAAMISVGTVAEIKRIAKAETSSMSSVVRRLLIEALAARKQKGATNG